MIRLYGCEVELVRLFDGNRNYRYKIAIKLVSIKILKVHTKSVRQINKNMFCYVVFVGNKSFSCVVIRANVRVHISI